MGRLANTDADAPPPTHCSTRVSTNIHPTHTVMLSYAVLIIVALETIAVMSIRNGVSLSERARRVRTGRNGHVASMLAKLKPRKRRDATLPTANAGGGGGGGGGFGGAGGAGVMTSGSSGTASKAVDPTDDATVDHARDARISFHEWLAETLDLVTFIGLTCGYSIGAALIFVFAQAKQPGLCEISGAPAGCMDQLGRA